MESLEACFGNPQTSSKSCEPAGLQSPKIAESRKCETNARSPTPGGPPKTGKYDKNTERKKRPQTSNFWAVFVFFRSEKKEYFGGANLGLEDFVLFSYFRNLGGFGLCSRPAGSQNKSFQKRFD